MIKNAKLIRIKGVGRVRHCCVTVKGASSGVKNFSDTHDALHLPTTDFQKRLLGFGSAIISLANPWRGDMIAAMSETTGLDAVQKVRTRMLESDEGKKILEEKPRISSSTVDVEKLCSLSEGTVGKAYFNFLKKYNYTPDARLAVRFVEDRELAYVVQRYREVHDLVHTVLEMPTNMLGEVTVKWVEGVQTRWPMCFGGALFGAVRLSPKHSRRHYSTQPRLSPDVQNSGSLRKHPGSVGLRRVSLPEDLRTAINIILKDRNMPNISEEAKRLNNYIHSRKAPADDETVREAHKQFSVEVHEKVAKKENETEEEKELRRKFIQGKVLNLMKSRIYHWKPLDMSEAMCHYYLAARAAPEYAAVRRVFNEILLRDKTFQPKNIFDFGSGVGTVAWAAHALWGTTLKEYFTVDPSASVNDLARLILQKNDPEAEPFVANLYQRQFLPATARKYDLVVSSFSLMELESQRTRLETLANLWSKTNKYLILIEKGTLAGYHLISEARDALLHISSKSKDKMHVFAPCPHDLACPRLGDDTPCNFSVSYAPLDSQDKSLKEYFSYVILRRGEEQTENWPRIVREVLRRHKHVICRVCTPQGKLEDAIFTKKKDGKDIYRCAKYSNWGDMLPIAGNRLSEITPGDQGSVEDPSTDSSKLP